MLKEASVTYPIHELISQRWSPVSISDKPVEREKLASLLEAARWAPSSYNEQPWSYIVADTEEAKEAFLPILVPQNAEWAKRAPILMLSVAHLKFNRNGKENRHAFHDVGLASENICIQAVSLGLVVHQMAGFDVDLARKVYSIPDDNVAVAAIAVGYPGDPNDQPSHLRNRDLAERERKPLQSFVFKGSFGEHYF